jgi:predicted nucleic acid-binding protein
VRDFLLDTQTVCYWYDTKCVQNQAVVRNIESLRRQIELLEHKPRLLVSVITLGEMEYGHRVNPSPDPSAQADYRRFIDEQLPVPLEVTQDTIAAYGELRSLLFTEYAPRKKREPKMRPEQLVDPITSRELGIQENDLWLCSQAIAHSLVLVTNDAMRPIRRVSKQMQSLLLIQDWTVPDTARVE